MKEVIASIHIHSLYSDGLKTPPEIAREAARKGLDAIIITDHNVYACGFEDYYTFEGHKVLLLTGEEIHDQTRYPQKNHLLALGTQHGLSQLADDPQHLIDTIQAEGGLSFIAHAYDPALPVVNEANLSWVDWQIHGFTGLELWNNLSELKVRVKKNWQIPWFALFPKFMALEPPRQIREIWDSFLKKGQQIVAIGGADAHTLRYHIGPITVEVFPYSYHFQSILNHVLLDKDLSGDVQTDKKLFIDAVHEGRLFISNELIKPARGFRFALQDKEKIIEMGGRAVFNDNQTLIVNLPFPAKCRLVRDGEIIDKCQVKKEHSWKVEKAGVYRLECYRRYLGKQRGWIFSNPVYINN